MTLSSNKNLIKDSYIYLIGEVLNKALPFLMLPYLTRKLGTDGFGELSYYLVWLTLMSIFIGLSQEGAVARYYYFYGKRAISAVVKTGYIYSVSISSLLVIIAIFLKQSIAIYLAFLSLFQVLLNVQLSLRQCQRKALQYIIIQISASLSNIALTIIFLEFFAQPDFLVDLRILALLGANMIAFIIAINFTDKDSQQQTPLSKKKLLLSANYIFAFGFPLIFHHLSFFAKGQVDRLFIYGQYTSSELGIYSAGVQLASILPVLLLAINKAFVPYIYAKLKSEYNTTSKKIIPYALKSLTICAIPAIIGWLLPENIYAWFLGEQYAKSKYFTVVYLLGFGLNIPYLILVNFLFYQGMNKLISIGSIISTIFYLIALVVLGRISIEWIPLALLLSNLILLLYLTICVKKKLN